MFAPLAYDASEESKNAMKVAISIGSPPLFIGMFFIFASSTSSGTMSVFVIPGDLEYVMRRHQSRGTSVINGKYNSAASREDTDGVLRQRRHPPLRVLVSNKKK